MKKLSFIDFCSGIGGGRIGLEKNGLCCIGFSEIDKSAIKTYEKFFDTTMECNFGDITKIDSRALPDFDVMISGFPCQTFSIVGKREGLCDVNKGQIIFNLIQILREKKPKFFILENVKGLVNHRSGETLKIILKQLERSGYNVFLKVLNSYDFGLPQSRERVYFVGFRKDISRDFSFPSCFEIKPKLQDYLSPCVENIFSKETSSYQTFLRYLNNPYNKNRICLQELLQEDFLILDTRQSDLRIYRERVPTLRRDRQGILYVFKQNLYRLSALEALKLQGFGQIDSLEMKINDLKSSDLLRQCGNAMSVNVIDAIARQIFKEN